MLILAHASQKGGNMALSNVAERKRTDDPLWESEQKYRTLVEQSLQGLAIVQDLRIVFANAALAEITGYTVEELISLSPEEVTALVHPDDRALVWGRFRDRLDGKPVPPCYECRAIQKDGTVSWVEMFSSRIDYHGRPAVQAALIDITDHKRADEALLRYAGQLKALRQVALKLTAQLDLPELLHSIVSWAVELLQGSAGGFYLYRPERDLLEWAVAAGDNLAPIGTVLKKGEGLSGRVWETGEPLMVDDYHRWEGAADMYRDYPWTAVVGVPVRWAENFLGVVNVLGEAPRTFSQSDAELLSLFASHAAIAMENARLYDEAKSERDKLAVIMAGMEDGLDVVGRDYTVKFQNRVLFERFGDLTGQLCYEGYMGLAEPCESCPMVKAIETGEPHRAELQGLDSRHYEITSMPLRNPDGSLHALEIVRDITDRKMAEEEITHRTRQLNLVNEVGQRVAPILSFPELYQVVVAAVHEAFGYQAVAIFSVQDDEVVLEALAGPGHELMPSPYAQKVGEGMVGWVAQTGEPLLANDVTKEPRFVRVHFLDIAAEVDVPIRLGGKTVGVLAVGSDHPHIFSDTDLTALQTIADQVARAIENARLYEAAQRRISELSGLHEISEAFSSTTDVRETYGTLTKRMAELIGCQQCFIATYDEEAREIQAQPPGYGVPDELVQSYRYEVDAPSGRDFWNFRLQGALLVNDMAEMPDFFSQWVEGFRHFNVLIIPMLVEGSHTGLVIAANKSGGFAEDDSKLLSIFANQAAVIIENARLYQEELRRSLQRKTIAEVGRIIAAILDVDTLLSRVVDLIGQNFGYYFVHVFEVDPDGGYAVFGAGTGEVGRVLKEQEVRLRIGEEGIVGSVAESGQSLIVNDVSEEARYYFHPALAETRSELAVPIVLGRKIIGVLDVQSEQLNAFDESDQATLETLADVLAVAIENARLYEEEWRRGVELSVLLDTAQALVSSLDLEQVLETIARQAKALTQADGSRIYLLERDEETLKAVVVLEDYAEEIMATSVRVGEGITGLVAASGVPEIVNRAERDPRVVQIPGTPEEPQCLICVPLAVKGEVIGVMTLSREGDKEFKPSDLRLLTSLASQAATAIENARLYEETKRLAATDPLTGVWNRRHIESRFRTEMERARRFGHPLSVLVMDIDKLKLFNDTYGHLAGDQVIRTVAQVVLTSCREIDIVGRYGGDEFALILPEADAQGAATVGQRILSNLDDEPFQAPDGTKVPINISIGAASYPSDGEEVDRLFSLADATMYRAKLAGGGQFASLTTEPEELPRELAAAFDALQGLLVTIDAKDHYTFKHSQEVTERALALARAIGLSEGRLRALEVAARLHDLGKIGIRTDVLRKPGPLTPEQWKIIQDHPRLGYMLLRQVPQKETVRQAVLHHHERYDGTGYPDALKGEEIPLLARILAVADAFSAMVTDRPYRKALTLEEALDEVRCEAGKQFDPELAERFVELVEKGEIEC